jgi:hypothetical protein
MYTRWHLVQGGASDWRAGGVAVIVSVGGASEDGGVILMPGVG